MGIRKQTIKSLRKIIHDIEKSLQEHEANDREKKKRYCLCSFFFKSSIYEDDRNICKQLINNINKSIDMINFHFNIKKVLHDLEKNYNMLSPKCSKSNSGSLAKEILFTANMEFVSILMDMNIKENLADKSL